LHRFCLIHPCDRRTDGRTDRRTELRWLRRAIAVPAVARKKLNKINTHKPIKNWIKLHKRMRMHLCRHNEIIMYNVYYFINRIRLTTCQPNLQGWL